MKVEQPSNIYIYIYIYIYSWVGVLIASHLLELKISKNIHLKTSTSERIIHFTIANKTFCRQFSEIKNNCIKQEFDISKYFMQKDMKLSFHEKVISTWYRRISDTTMFADRSFKGGLMHIWRSANIFVFRWK